MLLVLLVLAGVTAALPAHAAELTPPMPANTVVATDSESATNTGINTNKDTNKNTKKDKEATSVPPDNRAVPGATAAGSIPPPTFIPSEEIDTDKAVDFPTNI